MTDLPTPKALPGVTKVSERDIEKHCTMYWRARQLIERKIAGPGQNHWPDRVFINEDGLHIYIEFKAPGKLPTPNQVRQMNRLRNSGCHVYVIDDKRAGITLLDLFADSEAYCQAIQSGVNMFNMERLAQEGPKH